MRGYLSAVLDRIRQGLTTLPARDDWYLIGLIGAGCLALCWVIGFATGLYVWQPRLDWSLPQLALLAFFVPAIGEEVAFRAAAIPTRQQKPDARLAIVASTLAYLIWHPVNAALFFPGWLAYFSDLRFLSVTAVLGFSCALLWRRTGSVWPPVVLHWLAVVVWKGFLGAPE